MDQKAAYEMTITEKLELLTVPDMVDAIWARIETQLDVDMPPDEGPGNPPSSPPSGTGTWSGIGMTIFIAALIAIIYFTNRKTNTSNNNESISPDNTTTISSPGNANDKPPPARTIVSSPQQSKPDKNTPQPLLSGKDSLITAGNGAGAFIPDSFINSPVLTPPPVVPAADTGKKKSRGVLGIKDADYRITPVNKDSSN